MPPRVAGDSVSLVYFEPSSRTRSYVNPQIAYFASLILARTAFHSARVFFGGNFSFPFVYTTAAQFDSATVAESPLLAGSAYLAARVGFLGSKLFCTSTQNLLVPPPPPNVARASLMAA